MVNTIPPEIPIIIDCFKLEANYFALSSINCGTLYYNYYLKTFKFTIACYYHDGSKSNSKII